LIAWPLVFAPQGLALLGVVGALILCLLIDYLAWRKQRFPGWMLRHRVILTVIVVISLLAAWVAHMLRPEVFFHPAIYYAV
jgi:signal transduction histidine kinase